VGLGSSHPKPPENERGRDKFTYNGDVTDDLDEDVLRIGRGATSSTRKVIVCTVHLVQSRRSNLEDYDEQYMYPE
jgi:hypothetical protein